MLSVEDIRSFIENDLASDKKQYGEIAQRYYDAEHDILGYKIYFFDAEGNYKEDKTKSNIKISHPFFTEIIDQAVQYLLSGKDGFIKSDKPELQKELDERFNENEDFMAEIYEIVTCCMVKGDAYAYAYKGEDGKVAFSFADSQNITEVRANSTDDGCEYVIHCYVERIDKDSKKIKRIEVWDKDQVTYYNQVDDGEITLDEKRELNPRPHTLYTKGKNKKVYYDSFGQIPFFRMDNNHKRTSDLAPIKALIDDYDLLNCGLSNNIQDSAEALCVVRGFEGDNLDELMTNVKAKRHIGVDGEGGVDYKTVEIPVEARKAKLEIDERNIFRFGMGVNTAELKDSSATTSIAIKAAYSLLDLKCNKLEIRLKQFMRKLLRLVLDEINKNNKTAYTQGDIYFEFDREIITNALENAQIEQIKAGTNQTVINYLLSLATYFDNETLMQSICQQLEIDYEEIKSKLPKPDEDDDPYEVKTALKGITPEDGEPNGGGDVIA